ncbi:D-sedoheptulose 7-phosphate isomerase [Campylobacter jejuni]|uniref:D-sedoheptulose 7-phosphate isomerase n=1 Tax=Campylobacter jejuni TaxID=197 RepID=UPI00069BA6ED|nr:D-sedoheptulose 7-phosphate isomerase [Campylobacter jejuni]HEE9520333.1 D-sedoheptulose 7-phosphate isomerase [Campylobacter jejuni subsp. jejuni]EAH4794816.1 SIS domain-containing protein [Campylobacter jejuni]EAH6722614.1 SIS domain-containing protein [Campylobacter jejuni]EAJ3979846.1 SIS domain-containing protein [Campylobacter jejuni]EAJ5921206.1 SIS domain-containing protein [Campylobacter jejuni]
MENLNSYIKEHFTDSILVKEQILKDENLITLIKNASLEVIKAYRNGNKTLLAGNGGSAADAQHIAGEFVSRFYFDRPGIASIALSTDTSILTAISNDYGYENLFARQVQAQGVKGDVFIGISTSGNSKNILKALELCKQKEIISIGLSGASGGAMNELCDYCIKVPSTCTPRIQEAHILIGHIICAIVEEELFGKGFSCKQ